MSKIKTKKITGLVVSAGKSSRMGEFKPLMDYDGKTFLQQIISKLEPVCYRIIIVTGFNSEILKSQTIKSLKDQGQNNIFKKIRFVENNKFEKGMFTSLQKGVKEIRNAFTETLWVLYHFIDQPGLSADFYSDFIDQIDTDHNWIQPSFKNRNGHPILLKQDLFEVILNSSETSSLREVSRDLIVNKKLWECNYKNILQDIDTKEDYISETRS